MKQGQWLVGHSTHKAIRMRAVPGLLLQLCVWVPLLPVISRARIIILQGRRQKHAKTVSPSLCAGSSEEEMSGVSDIKRETRFLD